jgi:hypothetical protein
MCGKNAARGSYGAGGKGAHNFVSATVSSS